MSHKSNKKMWDKDTVKLLIIKYQEHENLYNVKNPMYEDRDKRSDSLYDICKKLNELNSNITIEDIKKKIHTLRTQYIKETRDIARIERSEPKLWCYNQLDFLRHHCLRKCKINYSNMDNCHNVNNEKKVSMDINSEIPAYPSSYLEDEMSITIKCEPLHCAKINIEKEVSIDVNASSMEKEMAAAMKSEPPNYTRNNLEEASIDIKSELPTNLDSNTDKEFSIAVSSEPASYPKINIERVAPNDVNSEYKTYSKNNMEKDVSLGFNTEHPSNIRCNKKKKLSKLEERIDNVKCLLIKRLEEKSDYDWLGKQVVFEMKSIKNKKIQRETAWKIQTILREATIEDAAYSKCQSGQLSSEIRLESQSSFNDCLSKEQPTCSSFSSPSSVQQSDSVDRSASFSRTPVQPIRPLQIIAVNSYNTNMSYLPSKNDLQPFDDIGDEEEFQCL